MVLNLLINAYKYTGPDKKIEVALYDKQDHTVVVVEDNGIGISKSEQKKVFEPFFRADNKLSGGPSGVGLGLAIVDHYLRHRWQLGLERRGSLCGKRSDGGRQCDSQ